MATADQVKALIRSHADGDELVDQVKARAKAGLPRVNDGALLFLQHMWSKHIARETSKLNNVCAATERTIALLEERRAALIAAAVTGQLDATSDRPGKGAA